MLGYCKQCRLYKFLSRNKKCDSCNSPHTQFNTDYDTTNIVYFDHNIDTTITDLVGSYDNRE